MTKDLYIFIGNKLISTDSILPLAYELKKRKFVNNIFFITIDLLTYESIKKNYVIFQAINKIGQFLFLGNKYKIYRDQKPNLNQRVISFFFRQIAKIRLTPFLIRLIIKCLFNNVVIFHFNLLDSSPWKFINKFIKATIYKVDRTWETDLLKAVTYVTLKAPPNLEKKLSIGNIIYFHKDSNALKDKRNDNKKKVYLPPTSNYESWTEFLKKNYKNYINTELKNNNLAINQKIITIMLGSFSPLPYLKNRNTAEVCFKEIVETIIDLKTNVPIFIKPHVISNESIYLNTLKSFSNANIVITQLHPGILAMMSKVFICNYYSTTISTGNMLSVPTIEYTDYHKEALKLTKQGSLYPEYVDFFINRDKEILKKRIITCLKKNKRRLKPFCPESSTLKRIIFP